MEKTKRHPAAWFDRKLFWKTVLLSVCITFVIEALGRHSLLAALWFMLSRPTTFGYNVLMIFFTLSPALAFRRRVFALALPSAIWLGLGLGQLCHAFFSRDAVGGDRFCDFAHGDHDLALLSDVVPDGDDYRWHCAADSGLCHPLEQSPQNAGTPFASGGAVRGLGSNASCVWRHFLHLRPFAPGFFQRQSGVFRGRLLLQPLHECV